MLSLGYLSGSVYALASEILDAEFCSIADKCESGSSLYRFGGSKELFHSSVFTVIKETAVTPLTWSSPGLIKPLLQLLHTTSFCWTLSLKATEILLFLITKTKKILTCKELTVLHKSILLI